MAALQHWRENTLCSLCGWPRDICRAQSTDNNVQVDVERCHITTALSAKQKVQNEDETAYHPNALVYSARVIPQPT